MLVCMTSAPLLEYFFTDFNGLEINGITLIFSCQSYQVSHNSVFYIKCILKEGENLGG